MNNIDLLELFGYLGSGIVAFSLMLKSMVKLRIFNLTGSVLVVIYCLIQKTYPLLYLNSFIAIVNIYHLLVYYYANKNKTKI